MGISLLGFTLFPKSADLHHSYNLTLSSPGEHGLEDAEERGVEKGVALTQLSWKTPFLEEKIAIFFLENTMNPAFVF